MPCVPAIPKIALLHIKTLYYKIKQFMNRIPYFISIDLNSLPDSIAYKYIAKHLNCVWRDFYGIYPITNHAVIKGNEFLGCIDFILYSKLSICIDVHINRHKNNLPLPDLKEPSDHLAVTASFII